LRRCKGAFGLVSVSRQHALHGALVVRNVAVTKYTPQLMDLKICVATISDLQLSKLLETLLRLGCTAEEAVAKACELQQQAEQASRLQRATCIFPGSHIARLSFTKGQKRGFQPRISLAPLGSSPDSCSAQVGAGADFCFVAIQAASLGTLP
jgi:hypothetical protein